MRFEKTRAAGLARLQGFVPKAGNAYSAGRNYDLSAPSSVVSQLSPYLRHRLVSEREVLQAVLAEHSPKDALSFVQEVFWRGYFKGWLEQRPSVWARYQSGLMRAKPYGYATAVAGETGIDCFDHWANELRTTGYLHNHARMWFASIWIFTLRLPWELGAAFFLEHLHDGDPASNTLSWRWVAGLHTKGRNYLAKADNIAKFTEGRFFPKGALEENAAPLEELEEHPLMPLPQAHSALPERALHLITEEDCSLEAPAGVAPAAVLGIVSPQSPRFAQAAVQNTAKALGGTAYLGHSWSAAIFEAASAAGTDQVIVSHLPVGPAADSFEQTRQRLKAAGITLHSPMQRYDAQVWPHATKGFFKLKKQIPALLTALEI